MSKGAPETTVDGAEKPLILAVAEVKRKAVAVRRDKRIMVVGVDMWFLWYVYVVLWEFCCLVVQVFLS